MNSPGYPDGHQQDPSTQQPYPQQPGNPQQPWERQQPTSQPGGFEQTGYQQAEYWQGQQFGGPMPGSGFKPVGDPGTLDLPWYGIGFGQAIARAFKKYARFDGRASRSEFWWFYLFSVIVSFVLSIPAEIVAISQSRAAAIGATPHLGVIYAAQAPVYLWALVVLLPTVAITWRRLHDTNRTGAWWFLNLACGIGGIVPLIMCIMDSNPEGQRFDRVQTAAGYRPGASPQQ